MKLIKPRWAALVLAGAVSLLLWTPTGGAQESRADLIAKQQDNKSKALQPEEQDRVEKFIKKMTEGGWFFSPTPRGLYPYFDSVYPGGGITLGAGYRKYVGDYAFTEVRGLYSFQNYKRFEFRAGFPNYAGGRVAFNALAGWMDATKIPYYGLGIDSPQAGETNFRLQETYVRGGTTIKPVSWFHINAGSGYDSFSEKEGTGTTPTVGDLYGPETAPGIGVSPSYVHSEVSAAIVWAPAEGYARRGGVYRYSFHDYRNVSGNLESFQLTRGELVQHIPIVRENWVLSLRGRMESIHGTEGQVPYYLLPWLGSGSTLRGYGTGRFRDRHSLLMTGEWRWIPNRFAFDMALFGDAGTVGPRLQDLNFSELKYDYGIGFRLHGPAVTALRIDLAHGNEGWKMVFAMSAPF
jgi:hypothetical protein